MSVDEAYDVYKMNLSDDMCRVARSTFGKLHPKDVITIDHTPVCQYCCHTCQNFRLILLSMIRCGFKGIHRCHDLEKFQGTKFFISINQIH